MSRPRAAVMLLAVVGCGDPGYELQPVIDLPAPGSEADPRPAVDELELSVARAGAAAPMVGATFGPGEAPVLPGVPFGDDLVVHLVGRRGDVEVAYGRTCAFSLAADAPPPDLHLWFSRTVHWAEADPPAVAARDGGAAWVTADGGIAVAMGAVDGAAVTAVEHLDPRALRWTTVAEVAPRTGGALVALADGRAVLLGGRDAGGAPHARIEIVDPFAAAAARVEGFDDPRLALDGGAAAVVDGGDVLVIGGRGDAGPVDTVWALRRGEGGTVEAPRQLAARLATARSDHTLTRLSDDVGAPLVVIGGVDAGGAPVATAELYRPLREAFSAGFAAAMVVPRRDHQAVRLPDGSVLVVGGVDAAGTPVRTLELFTLDGGFVAAGELPPDAGVVDAQLVPLPDGRILLSGGRTTPGGAATAAAYALALDPLDGSIDVLLTDDLERARAGHAAARLCDGTVVAIGGEPTGTAERYQPPVIDRR